MALQDLTFNKEDGKYTCSVQLSGDVGIHLEYSEKPVRLAIYQSMTGDNYAPIFATYDLGSIFDRTIVGVLPGMYLNIESETQPAVAKMLVNEN